MAYILPTWLCSPVNGRWRRKSRIFCFARRSGRNYGGGKLQKSSQLPKTACNFKRLHQKRLFPPNGKIVFNIGFLKDCQRFLQQMGIFYA